MHMLFDDIMGDVSSSSKVRIARGLAGNRDTTHKMQHDVVWGVAVQLHFQVQDSTASTSTHTFRNKQHQKEQEQEQN